MSENASWYEPGLSARILGESCESCMRAEFEYVCIWGTFVCRGCAPWNS